MDVIYRKLAAEEDHLVVRTPLSVERIAELLQVESLLHHLNDVHHTIKFTMELEKDGMLPYLDTKHEGMGWMDGENL